MRIFKKPPKLRMWITLCITFALPAQAAVAPKRPKLVVLVAVDQLRSDYLTRFEHLFLPARQGGKPGGFKYLMDGGAYFPQAQTNHAYNVTCVGHSTMLTGAFPYLSGIVANNWYDFSQRKIAYCTHDAEAPVVGTTLGSAEKGRSPRTLLVSTVGDELKNAMGGKPRVIAVSYKDRSSIMLGGRRADLALWINETKKRVGTRDEMTAEWVSSAYYLPEKKLPEWLRRWSLSDYVAKRAPKVWDKLLPEKAYALSTPMPPEFVGNHRGIGKAFPHRIDGDAGKFLATPFADRYTLETAIEAAKTYELGRRDVPDLLAVSLSIFDAMGHNFGFMSAEMQDAALRTDRALADFFAALDKHVPGGLANVALVLTADHGISTNPGYAERNRLAGGVYHDGDWLEKCNAHLRATFGFDDDEKPVVSFYETNIALDHALLKKRSKNANEVARALASWLRHQPFVAAAYTKQDLLDGTLPPTATARKLANNTHPDRTGDVVYAARPGHEHLYDGTVEGADHEVPSIQDASIPLIFMGAAFKPGRYYGEAFLNDLAPTLSAVLGIIPPTGSEGRVLDTALFAGGH